MTLEVIRRLYAFNEWANARYLESITNLSGEAFGRTIASSFPSIRDTFGHIAGAEWLWLRRWLGESPTSIPSWSQDCTLDILRTRLGEVEEERREFIAGLTDTRLHEPLEFRLLSGKPGKAPLLELMVHVTNHSTYHRGQLATLFRHIPATPPATDYLIFAGALQ